MLTFVFELVFVCFAILIRNEAKIPVTEASDFASIVESPFFVDKTLLISQMFKELAGRGRSPPVVEVLAGSRSGKTVNHDMIRRFLEVPVDDKGRSAKINTTANYDLFYKHKLKIFGNDLFQKHFGSHPVVFINYKTLSEVTNFDHMLAKFRQILLETFSKHNYLLSVNRIWTLHFNKTQFEMFTNPEANSKLHQYYIYCGFSILAKVLRVHFDKPVFVLIDDFHSVRDSPAFSTGEDKRRIENFMKEVNNDLLLSNNDVHGALLTSTLRDEFNLTSQSSELGTYYGLSLEETENLLSRFIMDSKEVKEATNIIIEKSGNLGKKNVRRNRSSVWAVMQYIASVGRTS